MLIISIRDYIKFYTLNGHCMLFGKYSNKCKVQQSVRAMNEIKQKHILQIVKQTSACDHDNVFRLCCL